MRYGSRSIVLASVMVLLAGCSFGTSGANGSGGSGGDGGDGGSGGDGGDGGSGGKAGGGGSGGKAGSGGAGHGGAGGSGGAGGGGAGGTGGTGGGGGGTGGSGGVVSGSPYDCNWGPPVITKLAASGSPPGGLAVSNVPQFVAFGFDDNRYEDGLQWALDTIKTRKNPAGKGNHCTFDGTPARFTFFVESLISDSRDTLAALHLRAYTDGNEVGNHTDTHATDLQANMNVDRWNTEMVTCNGYLTGLGIPRSEIIGFRTPFLNYTQATFSAIVTNQFAYDASVEHFLATTGEDWPYTLDNGRSANTYLVNDGPGTHPGLWELPVHEFMPPTGWQGVTGLDYNIWCAKKMNTTDALNLLKASLDLRFKGDPARSAPANRAPFFIGAHSDLYATNNPDGSACANTVAERRQVIEQFLDYALKYDPAVRVVPYVQVMNWMQHPIGLDGTKGH